MADSPAPDLLSSLPLEVLDNILSRLHICAVVRTSVLSRAWRGRWESLPSVDLTHSPGIVPAHIDSLLLRRSAPVRTFCLAAHHGCWYVDTLHDWLLYLSRNGARNLKLWFPRDNFRLHSSLYSCRELTSLNLSSCRLPTAPPGFTGFPCLEALNFLNVVIPEHGGKQLEALISSSQLIEKVKLMSVELIGDNPDDKWVIQGPNLRELIIVSNFPYGGRTEDLLRLQEGYDIFDGVIDTREVRPSGSFSQSSFGARVRLSQRNLELLDMQEKLRLAEETIRIQEALYQVQQQRIEQQKVAAKESNDYLALYHSQIHAVLQIAIPLWQPPLETQVPTSSSAGQESTTYLHTPPNIAVPSSNHEDDPAMTSVNSIFGSGDGSNNQMNLVVGTM